MKHNIEGLEAKIEKLEKNILDISKAQERTIKLFDEFMKKCAENFINIEKSFENLTQKKN